ncbi:MAG: hypothetical protein HN790_07720 [Methylococcales bacterium]|jgi:hypothetical protein|nr:hypothetical protein [Methylococcales bacterium]
MTNESTQIGFGKKIPVTMKLDESLVNRITTMKLKCSQFDENFSVTDIFIKAVDAELTKKELQCASADQTMM